MIIDGHAHIYERLTGYGPRGEFRPLGGGKGIWATGLVEQFLPPEYGDTGFLAETLLRLMDETGIDHAVLLQGGNYGFHNDYTAEAARKWPDRFTAAGTADPYAAYALDIVRHLHRDLGVHVLKFEISESWGLTGYHPALRLDGEELARLFAYADDNGLTVTLDMGPMGTASFQIDALRRVSRTYRQVTWVMTHCFFPKNDGRNPDRLAWMRELAGENFYFDIANLPLFGAGPYPYPAVQAFVREAAQAVTPQRLIWGTDIPGVLMSRSYGDLLGYLDGVLPPEDLAAIRGGSARRAYRIGKG